jgi:superfamily I DNA/RNA helicase
MIDLSAQQRAVIELNEDVFVTACPGSGKTRVLTAKIARTIEEGVSPQSRIAAVTFTNRAADEIAARLQDSGYSRSKLWSGTIHSFALEWILRPYASYIPSLRQGFSVADDHYVQQLVESLKDQYGFRFTDDVKMGMDRQGNLIATDKIACQMIRDYREQLWTKRLIDFDTMLFLAYDVLQQRPEIPRTLGAIYSLICIDEYQDTQDLQFGILSSIVRESNGNTRLFIVGDRNQAIYSSLGGLAMTVREIRDEFQRPNLLHRELTGNYRSTQRIVDFCSHLCEGGNEQVVSLADHAAERGQITYSNQVINKDALGQTVANIVLYHVNNGTKPEEICVLAPARWLLTEIGRQLVVHLPNIDLDASGLSPLRYQPDSLWFKLARLVLTDPTPVRFRTRMRWASDIVHDLESRLGRELPENSRSARSVLRILNALSSVEESGLAFLDDLFEQFFSALECDLTLHPELIDARQSFFDAAEARLIDRDNEFEPVENLKKMFRHPSGVVVNTCHASKGEEYSVIVCFGLLRGLVPHWQRIRDQQFDEVAEAKRILYVISSRAKKCLHLFSEEGRTTQSRNPYESTRELAQVPWQYDAIPQ